MSALMTFTSHIAGKNATVSIYPDRIEWEKAGGMSLGKMAAGAATMGMSLAKTGVRKGGATETVLMRSITSVNTKKDGFTNWAVEVIVPGNTVTMRVSKVEAERIKSLIISQLT